LLIDHETVKKLDAQIPKIQKKKSLAILIIMSHPNCTHFQTTKWSSTKRSYKICIVFLS